MLWLAECRPQASSQRCKAAVTDHNCSASHLLYPVRSDSSSENSPKSEIRAGFRAKSGRKVRFGFVFWQIFHFLADCKRVTSVAPRFLIGSFEVAQPRLLLRELAGQPIRRWNPHSERETAILCAINNIPASPAFPLLSEPRSPLLAKKGSWESCIAARLANRIPDFAGAHRMSSSYGQIASLFFIVDEKNGTVDKTEKIEKLFCLLFSIACEQFGDTSLKYDCEPGAQCARSPPSAAGSFTSGETPRI